MANRYRGLTDGARVSVLLALIAAACALEPLPREPERLQCKSGTSREVDVVPFARLAATNTRPRSVFPWPREAEDAIATVRDGHDHTGWKLPAGEEATATIDPQPWLAAPIRFTRAEMIYEGATPHVEVDLLDGCGGAVLETMAWTDPGEALDLGGRCAACLRLRVRAPEEGSLRELRLWSDSPGVEPPSSSIDAAALPADRYARSGVIEGFYGVPWSWRERRHMVLSLARAGFDTYLYAPKDDPLHRSAWRTPYPDADRAKFRELADLARFVGVSLVFGLSPFLDFDFAGSDDAQALVDKASAFAALGFGGIAILADDIEVGKNLRVDAALGSQHVQVTNRLAADLRASFPGLALYFVPTAYSDQRVDDFDDGLGYLRALAALDPSVGILWTGKDTSNATMMAADMDRFEAETGRRPILWDNYWATDGGDGFRGNLYLAALEGRAVDLPGSVDGLQFNPAIPGSPDRLSLATAAYYLAHPASVEPSAAREHAAALETFFSFGAAADAKRDIALLTSVMGIYDGHAQRPTAYGAMSEAIEAWDGAVEQPGVPIDQAFALLQVGARMSTLGGEIYHSGVDADLADDLVYPLEKARHEGDALLWTLALAARRMAGRSGDEERANAKAALDASDLSRFTLGEGESLGLFQRTTSLPAYDRGVAPIGPGASSGACEAEQPWSWVPFDRDAELSVFGLPGAVVEGGVVRWTPPYAGEFRGVVIAVQRAPGLGWGMRHVTLACAVSRRYR